MTREERKKLIDAEGVNLTVKDVQEMRGWLERLIATDTLNADDTNMASCLHTFLGQKCYQAYSKYPLTNEM